MSAPLQRYPAERLVELLPHPAPEANKYTRGTLAFIGGSAAYPGAALLACAAAQRIGAGYVLAHCAPETVPLLRAQRPSLVVRSWDEIEPSAVRSHEGHPAACLIGCGMDGADDAQRGIVLDALSACELPCVLDGGALAAVASDAGQRLCIEHARAGSSIILTPHGGEAAVLAAHAGIAPVPAGAPIAQQAAFACALSEAYAATVLLKGPASIISNASDASRPDVPYLMDEGTPALAKAGTGDVLAGMVGALLAQGLDASDAAVLAATLHARAGRAAAARLGDISVCAEDVLEAIPRAIRFL